MIVYVEVSDKGNVIHKAETEIQVEGEGKTNPFGTTRDLREIAQGKESDPYSYVGNGTREQVFNKSRKFMGQRLFEQIESEIEGSTGDQYVNYVSNVLYEFALRDSALKLAQHDKNGLRTLAIREAVVMLKKLFVDDWDKE